jgi:hypothetical protein
MAVSDVHWELVLDQAGGCDPAATRSAGTEASYRRRTAIEKRRSIMENYADWLNGESSKVIAFPTSKKA